MILGRRKFFSFFGTGVAMLAKPDLFLPDTTVRSFGQKDLEAMIAHLKRTFDEIEAQIHFKRVIGPLFMLSEQS
jgi:hypothetical protein